MIGRLLALATALLALLAAAAPASAATNTFQGPGNDWNVASNWSQMSVPDATDDVVITGKSVVLDSDPVAGDGVTNSLELNAGSTLFIAGGLALTVDGGAASSIGAHIQLAGTLNLQGATTWTANTIVFDLATATLNNSGDLDLQGNNASFFDFGAFGSVGLLNNTGSITRSAGTGTVPFQPRLDNDGDIEAQSGTIRIDHGGPSASTGTFVAQAGAKVSFHGAHQIGGVGSRVGGPGTVSKSGGGGTNQITAINAGAVFDPARLLLDGVWELQLNVDATVQQLELLGGARGGSGTLTVTGQATFGGTFATLRGTGTTTLGSTATISNDLALQDSHSLNLGPSTTWSAGDIGVAADADVNVGSGEQLDITGTGTLQGSGSGLLNNAGTVTKSSVGTNAFNADVSNSGTFDLQAGIVDMQSGTFTQSAGLTDVKSGATLTGGASGTSAVLNGGTLKGGGTIGGSLNNAGGTMGPGASPGTLTIGGNYTQGPGGTLRAEIAGTTPGTQHDRLVIGGTASLAGTLAIARDPGFDPQLSDTFEVLHSNGVLSGDFATVTGTGINGRQFSKQTTPGAPGTVTLGVESVVGPPPPAPSNTTAPSIPASAQVGETVRCDPGGWTGSPAFAYQWLRNGSPIAGATGQSYTLAGVDGGARIVCRVTATNAGGSTQADSNTLVPTKPPPSTASPAPPAPAPAPAAPTAPAAPAAPAAPLAPPAVQTIRGDQAFEQGTANDLYLACTRLDLILIDVLPAGRTRVSVTGAADLRLAGQTVDILLDGKRVGSARVAGDGAFAARVKAPARKRRRSARYQARAAGTVSQRLKLERRMVATTLQRRGGNLVLRGKITKPFANRPAVIEVERYLSCGRRETLKLTRRVRPNRTGAFAVSFPLPDGANAAIYRARTKVARRARGKPSARTFTLPRAIDLP